MSDDFILTSSSIAQKKLAKFSNLAFSIEQQTLDEFINAVSPSLFLFDYEQLSIMLPVISKIRKLHSDLCQIFCIADKPSVEDQLRILNHDIDYVNPNQLSEMVSNLLSKKNQQRHKVLIVEDDESQALFAQKILQNADIKAEVLFDEKKLMQVMHDFKPDLVLMDMYLTGCDGSQLTRLIRKDAEFLVTPIVFMTGDFKVETRMKALDAGADDLLTKPIRPKLLVAALLNRIQRFKKNLKNNPDPAVKTQAVENLQVKDLDNQHIETFIEKNNANDKASVIWLRIKNQIDLQKKVGLSQFKILCHTFFELLQEKVPNTEFTLHLSQGIIVIGFKEKERNKLKKWFEKLNQWCAKNYFNSAGLDVFIELFAVALTHIPGKQRGQRLIALAESQLLNMPVGENILFIGEDDNDKQYFLLKAQLENAIKTRNFNWVYQPLVATADESQDYYQLLLRILTDGEKELKGADFLPVAKKAGLINILDQFVLEQAIRFLSQKGHRKLVNLLINQSIHDFADPEISQNRYKLFKNMRIGTNQLFVQFGLMNLQDRFSQLKSIGQQFKALEVHLCVNGMPEDQNDWKALANIRPNWLRINLNEIKSKQKSDVTEWIGSVKLKAQKLNMKLVISHIDSAEDMAIMWKSKVDILQGNFIQAPTE